MENYINDNGQDDGAEHEAKIHIHDICCLLVNFTLPPHPLVHPGQAGCTTLLTHQHRIGILEPGESARALPRKALRAFARRLILQHSPHTFRVQHRHVYKQNIHPYLTITERRAKINYLVVDQPTTDQTPKTSSSVTDKSHPSPCNNTDSTFPTSRGVKILTIWLHWLFLNDESLIYCRGVDDQAPFFRVNSI